MRGLLAVVAACVGAFAPCASAAIQYSIRALPTYAPHSVPSGLNEAGEVVGYMSSGSGARYFLDRDGQFAELTAFENNGFGGVNGINDHGTISGWVNGAPILYENGQTTVLPTLAGYPFGYVRATNNLGMSVGVNTPVISDERPGRAFLYNAGQITDLGTLPGYDVGSAARGINDSGQVVGIARGNNQIATAFLYSAGVMTNLGTLGGTIAAANAINASGVIVGSSFANGSDFNSEHAFIYSNGVMRDLGTLPGTSVSVASDINTAGNVVGSADYRLAFLYREGAMHDLNSLVDPASGWRLVGANGINDMGQIIGIGLRPGSPLRQALLLTPVPEPSVALVFLCSVYVGRRRR